MTAVDLNVLLDNASNQLKQREKEIRRAQDVLRLFTQSLGNEPLSVVVTDILNKPDCIKIFVASSSKESTLIKMVNVSEQGMTPIVQALNKRLGISLEEVGGSCTRLTYGATLPFDPSTLNLLECKSILLYVVNGDDEIDTP